MSTSLRFPSFRVHGVVLETATATEDAKEARRKIAQKYLAHGAAAFKTSSWWGYIRRKLAEVTKHRARWAANYTEMAREGKNGWVPTSKMAILEGRCDDPEHY